MASTFESATDRETTMNRQYLFSSESVSEGHPDKLADLISDTLLDAFLARDPQAKVACETFLANELIVIGGEFRTTQPDLIKEITEQAPALVRLALREVGYRSDIPAIDPDHCEIRPVFNVQSEDIHQGWKGKVVPSVPVIRD